MFKYSVGQPLIVVRDDIAGGFFTNAVGEVTRRGTLVGRNVYELHMPQFRGIPCHGCGAMHMHRGLFPEDALRPLKDPDDTDTRIEEKELDNVA